MKGHVPSSFFGSTSFNELTARNISGVKAGQAGTWLTLSLSSLRTKHTLISCQFNISFSPSSHLCLLLHFSPSLLHYFPFFFFWWFFLILFSISFSPSLSSSSFIYILLYYSLSSSSSSFHSLFHFNKVSSAKDPGKVDTAQSHFLLKSPFHSPSLPFFARFANRRILPTFHHFFPRQRITENPCCYYI